MESIQIKLECKNPIHRKGKSDADLQKTEETAQEFFILLDKNSCTEERPFYFDEPVYKRIKTAVVAPWETFCSSFPALGEEIKRCPWMTP